MKSMNPGWQSCSMTSMNPGLTRGGPRIEAGVRQFLRLEPGSNQVRPRIDPRFTQDQTRLKPDSNRSCADAAETKSPTRVAPGTPVLTQAPHWIEPRIEPGSLKGRTRDRARIEPTWHKGSDLIKPWIEPDRTRIELDRTRIEPASNKHRARVEPRILALMLP